MAINQLPPQAYTKDDVTKAYLWIQSQPDYIKNMATSKETLVTLYLQARRNGSTSLETLAPVSSKDFKTQLQNLANELEQFKDAKPTASAVVQTNPQPSTVTPTAAKSDDLISQTIQDFQKPPVQNTLPTQESKLIQFALDPRSEQIIRSVKAQLNMESERDIIRMLLVLGFDRLKGVFPNR